MKSNYKNYGETINFEISYRILSQPSSDGSPIGIGFFFGKDENMRLMMFGLAIIMK